MKYTSHYSPQQYEDYYSRWDTDSYRVLAAVAFLGAMFAALLTLFAAVAYADDSQNMYGQGGNYGGNFTASGNLSGNQEVPSISTSGYGSFSLTSPDNNSASFSLSVFNIEDATAAHLHCGPLGVNGPVVGPLWSASSTNVNGTLTGTIDNGDIQSAGAQCATPIHDLDDLKMAIQNGHIYANVHSDDYPNGEIRGQLSGSGYSADGEYGNGDGGYDKKKDRDYGGDWKGDRGGYGDRSENRSYGSVTASANVFNRISSRVGIRIGF